MNLKKKIHLSSVLYKKKAHSAESRIKKLNTTKKIKIMPNTLNYRDLAFRSVRGLDYDELLELQAETGLSIRQLEYMYYKQNQ